MQELRLFSADSRRRKQVALQSHTLLVQVVPGAVGPVVFAQQARNGTARMSLRFIVCSTFDDAREITDHIGTGIAKVADTGHRSFDIGPLQTRIHD